MDITARTRRTLTAVGAAGALTVGILGAATPATAAPGTGVAATSSAGVTAEQDPANPGNHCGPYWCRQTITGADAKDPGARWAQSIIMEANNGDNFYRVSFWPQREELRLLDRRADGHQARAEVVVRNHAGHVVDRDTYFSRYDANFNLGTPDGSGDIPEGYRVAIRVCADQTNHCSPWARGTA